jgi:pimeloyl-ACP methyl ester carboxylesterase
MPDLRGFGWSSVPDHGYDKETLTSDMLGLLDVLGIERVGVIGHDWGGWIGFLACLRTPGRFDGLLALSTMHPFTRAHIGTVVQSWRFGYQLLIGAPLVGRMLVGRTPLLNRMLRASNRSIEDPSVYSSLLAEPSRGRASEQLYRTFATDEVRHLGRYRHARLHVPTRLVVGSEDPVIRPEFLEGWSDHADDMTVETLAGVGHFIPEQAPQAVAQRARTLFGAGTIEQAVVAAGGIVVGTADGDLAIEGPNSA